MSYLSKGRLCPKKTFVILCYRTPETRNNSPLVGLLRGQLDYWFSKKPHGFYKFLEPCKHPLYRSGDSWTEELGLSRRVFNSIFDTIGVRYKSKTEFMKAKDKFQGMLYASYLDRKTNQTFFIQNHEITQQQEIDPEKNKDIAIFKAQAESLAKKTIVQLPGEKKKESRGEVYFNCRSRNDTNSRSCTNHSGGTIGGKNNTSENTSSSSLSSTSLSSTIDEKKKIANDMKNIWKKEIGEMEVDNLTLSLISRLCKAYTALFKESLEEWKTYCRKIASSKFLMGEGRSKSFQKVWITWAIKPESYERIQAGEFTLGDRSLKQETFMVTPEEEETLRVKVTQEIMTSSHDPLWIKACLNLLQKLDARLVQKWLYPLTLIRSTETSIELQAPNFFMRDWLQKNLLQEIKTSFQDLLGDKIQYCTISAKMS